MIPLCLIEEKKNLHTYFHMHQTFVKSGSQLAEVSHSSSPGRLFPLQTLLYFSLNHRHGLLLCIFKICIVYKGDTRWRGRTFCPCFRKVHRTTRKEQKHKLQKPRPVSNFPPTTWSWTRVGAVTWHSGQSLGSVQSRGRREGQGQAEGGGFHSWAPGPLGTLPTLQQVEQSCWETLNRSRGK